MEAEEENDPSRYEVSRERFVAAMMAQALPLLDKVQETRREINDAQSAFRARVWEQGGESKKELRARLQYLQTELQYAEAAIRHWSPSQLADLGSWFGTEFDHMQDVPRLHFCEIIDSDLLVATRELFGFNPRDKTWHRIGRVGFKVPLDVYSSKDILDRIRFKNLDGATKASPQVNWNEEGTVECWGPTQAPLLHAYQQQRMRDVVSILIRFAECAEQLNLYDGWPIVDEQDVPAWYLTIPEHRW